MIAASSLCLLLLGTGKTHSVVNVAATTLAEGKKGIMVSANAKALASFKDKTPPIVRGLMLDLSCCKLEQMHQFQQSLEILFRNLQTHTSDNIEKVRLDVAKSRR